MKQPKPAKLASVFAMSSVFACSALHAQQPLGPRDFDFHFIVTKNAERIGMPLSTSPEAIVSYAKSLCADMDHQGAQAVVEKNRERAAALQGDQGKKQQVADMVLRNAVSTYCGRHAERVSIALSTPQQQARPEPQSESTLFQRFLKLTDAAGLDAKAYPSYTEAYVKERARFFCSLMNDGEMMKLTGAISNPPVRWTEAPKEKPRLETAILVTGTPTYCARHNGLVEQWRQTFERRQQ
jgi:hypothetical protein